MNTDDVLRGCPEWAAEVISVALGAMPRDVADFSAEIRWSCVLNHVRAGVIGAAVVAIEQTDVELHELGELFRWVLCLEVAGMEARPEVAEAARRSAARMFESAGISPPQGD